MAKPFRPYADDETTFSVGELSFENGTDRLTVSGNTEFTRDRKGLAKLDALVDMLLAAQRTLKGDPNLPADVGASATEAPVAVKNPFA